MNRIYRHVWNKAQGRYIVAAETASSGRGSSRPAVSAGAVFSALLTVLCVNSAYAQTVVAPGGATAVYRAANGVQIINIEAANQAGLSHNRYTNYNVEQNGTVLNNGNKSQLSRNSQLAGQVLNNPNLSAEARVILNEVVAPNRSTLRGFTEVLGSRADVVLANPWGITCAGCGFINTDRAVLSTGTPQFGPSGNLTEFRTIGGDILIEGAGLDATSTRAIDLVARSIRVDGQINAADLGITVGASQWNYENRNSKVIDTDGKPLYALDSSRLGGMYANRIAIIATEHGVGVRMMGDVAASADDFQMDANGRVEMLGRASAARDLRIRQWGTEGVDAFQVVGTEASLTAGKTMHVMASGGLVLTDATIKAEGDMIVSAQQLIDRAGSQANGARAAAGNLNLDVANTAIMNNTSWSAQQALSINAGALGIGADGATLAAGANAGAANRALAVVASTGDIDLSGANVAGAQDVRIASKAGAVRVGKSDAQSLAAGQDLSITAATQLDNRGTVGAKRALNVSASDAGKTLAVVNRGTIQSEGTATLAGTNGKNNLTLDNQASASIATSASLSITGSQVDNASIIQSGDAATLSMSGKFTNIATGQLLGQGMGSVVKVDAGSLDNAGVVQSKGAITVKATGALTQAATGAIQTLGTDQAGSGWGLELNGQTLDNQGTISSGGTLATTTGTTIDNAGTIQSKGAMALSAATKLTQTGTGQILSADTASLKTAVLDNTGRIQATKSLTVGTSEQRTDVNNRLAGVIAADALDAWVMNYVNSGTTQADSKTTIDANGRINNATGATITASLAGTGASVLNATGGIANAGTVNSVGALRTSAADIENTGKIAAKAGLVVTAVTTLVNKNSIQSEQGISIGAGSVSNTGTVGAVDALTMTVTGDITNRGTLQGAYGSVFAKSISNYGDLKAAGGININASDSLYNIGNVLSENSISLATASLSNLGTGRIVAGTALSANGVGSGMALLNGGTMQAGADLSIGTAAQRVAVSNQGDGKLVANGNFSLYGTTVVNGPGARMQWMKNGLIDAESLSNQSATSVMVGSLLADSDKTYVSQYDVTGAFTNSGAIHSGGDAVINAGSVYNSSTAGLSALNDLSVTASAGNSEAIRNQGAFYAGHNLTLTATGGRVINAGAENGTLDAEGDMAITAADIVNQGSMRAKNINLSASNSFVNRPDGPMPVIYIDDTSVLSDNETRIRNVTGLDCFAGIQCDSLEVYERIFVLPEKLSFALPAFKPQILADGTLTVNYGTSGENTAGILSAKTIKIAGTGAFTNQDYHLDEITFATRRAVWTDRYVGGSDVTRFAPQTEAKLNQAPDANDNGIIWGAAGAWTPDGTSFRQDRSHHTYAESGAGVFGDTVEFTGGTLRNLSSPKAVTNKTTQASGSATESVKVGGVGGLGAISGASLSTLAGIKVSNGLTLGGIVIKLPSNPNGYFVPSKSSGSKYLIETNPLFQAPSSFLGSNYLAEQLGFNPDTIIKRLGDSNYEAYLIRQQLIGQTGKNLLNQKLSEGEQMQRMMDSAASSAKGLGLTYGQPLTADQLANLKEDIVWMVETEVNGEKVLAPVVYLSQETRDAVTGGSSMMANNMTINADSVENTGGTLGGKESLAITSKGDITNTSGTITGGTVALKSTEGSIVNQTSAKTAGDELSAQTDIGKTAGIVATGTLSMDAKQDIKIIGANVAAQNANIAAGGNVTVDTIVDKTATSSSSGSSGFMSNSYSNTTTRTETNIGSKLDIGGNLALKSGGDTTIAGSDVKVGGNLSADTGGNFNVLARQDKVETETSSGTSGFGVGGGLYGSQKTTTNDFQGTNSGSTLTVGGNANVTSQGTMTVQGSDVNIGGNAAIDAKQGIAILDGLDEQRSTTHTETTTFGKIGGNSAAEATASAASKAGFGSKAAAEASAEASGSVKLAEKTVTNTASGSKTSVASTFNVGGSLDMKTDGTVTVQGSDVKAGGDLSIDAKTVNVLAGRNETYSSADSKSDSIGFYGEAGAKAGANANAMGGNASASASAEAESTLTVGARTESASFSEGSTTNRGSTLSGGNNVTIKAKDDATFVGAAVTAGNDLSVQATNIKSMAAQDTTYSTEASGVKTAGVYLSAGSSASAEANATGGSANAGAEASAGLRYAQSNESASSGSVTNQTTSFTAGGNVNRNASGTITDQGTQITAGGDINQKATEIREVAAQDSSWERSNASSLDARIGVYAGAEAGADSRTGSTSADASIGVKASVQGGTESASSSSSTAVTSRYQAGGNINSTSTNGTTLIGTQFESGGNVNINAGSLDYQAARNTESSSSNSLSGSAEVKVGIIGSAGVNGSVEVEGATESSSSSTARAGGINAGGAININTGGNATFEGTNLQAGKGVNVGAGGDVSFNAATSTSENSSLSAGLSLSGGTSGSGSSRESEGAIGASLEATKGASTTAVGSNISAGSGGVNISGGKNVNLEGTQVQTTGATTVSAGGTVNMTEAKSSEYQVGVGVTASANGSKGGEDGSKGSGGLGIGVEAGGSSSSQGVNIQSGGGTRVINNAPASSVVAPRAPAAAAPAVVVPASSTGASIQVAPTSASGGRQVSQSLSLRSSGVDAAPSAGIAVAPAVMAPASSAVRVAPSAGIAIAPAVAAPAPSTSTAIQVAPASASGGRQASQSMSLRSSGVDAAPSAGIAVAPAVMAPAASAVRVAPSAGIAIAPAVAAPAPSASTAIQLAPASASGGRQASQSMSLGASGVEAEPSAGIVVAPTPASGGRQIAPSVSSGRANLAVPAN